MNSKAHVITRETPGKINLFLKIGKKRPDCYHELHTLFYPIRAIYDTVEVDFSKEEISVTCDHPGVPDGEANICFKAAQRYLLKAGLKAGAAIRITKRIPVAAGMGGGSSDAGAVLLIFQQYFHALSKQELREIALTIGADVPFFLNPVPSEGKGIGEILKVADMPEDLSLLIIPPQFPVSAGWAYKNMKQDPIAPEIFEHLPENAKELRNFFRKQEHFSNDLAPALLEKFPLVRTLMDQLKKYAPVVSVTGSGPTLFAVFSSVSERNKSCETISDFLKQYSLSVIRS